jgi:lipid A ethanolaminephosphotransferase
MDNEPLMKAPFRSPLQVLLAGSAWLAVMGNIPLWLGLWQLPEGRGGHGVYMTLILAAMTFSLCVSLLSVLSWRGLLRPALMVLVLITGLSTHYMLSYGIVIDTTMVTNVLQTDVGEARDQMSLSLLLTVLLLTLPLAWWMWRRPLNWPGLAVQSVHNLGMILAGVVFTLLLTYVSFKDFSTLMRNHTQLRYLINPLNTVYALAEIALIPTQVDQSLQPLGTDAVIEPLPSLHRQQSRITAERPWGDSAPLLVIALGETARSANFSLNGYTRPTNPQLQREDVLSYRQVRSCGTSTAVSLPCMFSHLGREGHSARSSEYENLLDVLTHAGYQVLWLDNQSGCKGLCDRIHSVRTNEMKRPAFCSQGECMDDILLPVLKEQLQPSANASASTAKSPSTLKGTVVVLHLMGSHGPAYFKRSRDPHKPFQPECKSIVLADCSTQQIVNAYDNSLVFTDHILAELIRWLREQSAQRPTGLIYLSDHGESLGENSLYLHGLPYAIAPDVQKHVPLITWWSDRFQQVRGIRNDCLRQDLDRDLSHDHFFHSVLGLMRVKTEAYRPDWDLFRRCDPHARP